MSETSLDELVAACWDDHAKDPSGVFDRLTAAAPLVTEPSQVPALAGLVVHVVGGHLGRWSDGLALLRRLDRPTLAPDTAEGRALARSRAILELCAGDLAAARVSALAARSGARLPFASDLARILALAAAALAEQGRTREGQACFEEAMSLAAYGPTGTDPTARALAVTANNLAAAFEERPSRTPAEDAFMVRAAEAARDWWGLAGTWLEAGRAEHRLSSSLRHAGNAVRALEHARRCLRIVEQNGSDPLEAAFALEQLARAHRALADAPSARRARDEMAACAARVGDADDRASCERQLASLDGALSG